VPATADRVEISNAAEDALRSVTGTPKLTDAQPPKQAAAESASRMPPSATLAASQQAADADRERQVKNIAVTYKVVGERETVQANVLDRDTGEVVYQAPSDQMVEVRDANLEVVGEMFDSLM